MRRVDASNKGADDFYLINQLFQAHDTCGQMDIECLADWILTVPIDVGQTVIV